MERNGSRTAAESCGINTCTALARMHAFGLPWSVFVGALVFERIHTRGHACVHICVRVSWLRVRAETPYTP